MIRLRLLMLPVLLCIHCFALPFAEARELTVRLFSSRGPISSIAALAPFTIEGHGNPPVSTGLVEFRNVDGTLFLKPDKAAGNGMPVGRKVFLGTNSSRGLLLRLPDGTSRRYRGRITISPMPGGTVSVSNNVQIRDYIISVTGSESLPNTPQEALKAQCVLVRTLLLRRSARDVLLDSTETQAYMGIDYERPEARRAFEATLDEVLYCDGRPVEVFFHAACGGATSSSSLFRGKPPTMKCDRSVKCTFCQESPFWAEKKTLLSKRVFLRKFPDGAPIVEKLDAADRPIQVRYKNGKTQTGYEFWLLFGQSFGWGKIPGTRFTVRESGDRIELGSNGAGHGVGYCQWGAAGLAGRGRGRSYRDILQYYFPGTELVK